MENRLQRKWKNTQISNYVRHKNAFKFICYWKRSCFIQIDRSKQFYTRYRDKLNDQGLYY